MLPIMYNRQSVTSPLSIITDARREFDRVFDRLLSDDWPAGRLAGGFETWLPAVDVQESEKELRFTVEAPGLGPDDLQVNVTDDVLTISGEKKVERDDREGAFRLVERRAGRFERSFALPAHAEAEHVSAEYENGVLTVVVPKRGGAKTRRVEIRSSFFQKLLGGRRKHEENASSSESQQPARR
jgi:HSP20 family protein